MNNSNLNQSDKTYGDCKEIFEKLVWTCVIYLNCEYLNRIGQKTKLFHSEKKSVWKKDKQTSLNFKFSTGLTEDLNV